MTGWSATELAYVAGIIDGEGAISLSERRGMGELPGRLRLVLAVANTDWALLGWLKDTLNAGTIRPLRHNAKWKPCGEWRVSGRQAEVVLSAVQPYLIVKARQAEIALAFRALVRPARGGGSLSPADLLRRDGLKRELRVLNQRGLGGGA